MKIVTYNNRLFGIIITLAPSVIELLLEEDTECSYLMVFTLGYYIYLCSDAVDNSDYRPAASNDRMIKEYRH